MPATNPDEETAYFREEAARQLAGLRAREAQRGINAKSAAMPLADPPPYWDRRALSEWAMGPGF